MWSRHRVPTRPASCWSICHSRVARALLLVICCKACTCCKTVLMAGCGLLLCLDTSAKTVEIDVFTPCAVTKQNAEPLLLCSLAAAFGAFGSSQLLVLDKMR